MTIQELESKIRELEEERSILMALDRRLRLPVWGVKGVQVAALPRAGLFVTLPTFSTKEVRVGNKYVPGLFYEVYAGTPSAVWTLRLIGTVANTKRLLADAADKIGTYDIPRLRDQIITLKREAASQETQRWLDDLRTESEATIEKVKADYAIRDENVRLEAAEKIAAAREEADRKVAAVRDEKETQFLSLTEQINKALGISAPTAKITVETYTPLITERIAQITSEADARIARAQEEASAKIEQYRIDMGGKIEEIIEQTEKQAEETVAPPPIDIKKLLPLLAVGGLAIFKREDITAMM